MAQPYVGEIRMFAGNFEPVGWMYCDGRLLAISEYDTLFNLIGTTYGGDGENNFGLPDLRGRLPVHFGNGFTQGEMAGVEEVTLTVSQIPAHSHSLLASGDVGQLSQPGGNVLAQTKAGVAIYIASSSNNTLTPQTISSVGGSLPHTNFQPYLCLNFIISLFGLYPSQT